MMAPVSEVVHVEGEGFFGDSSRIVNQAMHHYRKGQLDQAAERFEQALKLDSSNGAVHNNLGLIYYEQRRLVLAANHFDAAMQLRPEDARPINSLGMTLEAGGRVMAAIELYDQASSLEPDNPLYLGNSIRARVRLGERSDELIEQLKHLVLIETRPDWLAWADEQLAVHRNPILDRGPANSGLQPQSSAVKRRVTDQPDAGTEPLELLPSNLLRDSSEHLDAPETIPP